jgi:hypothetical protein
MHILACAHTRAGAAVLRSAAFPQSWAVERDCGSPTSIPLGHDASQAGHCRSITAKSVVAP